jgi:hypothetical protein
MAAAFLALGSAWAAPAQAKLEDDSKTLFAGVGLVSEDMGLYANNPGADGTSLYTTLYVNLAVSARLRLGRESSWFFAPAVTYTPLGVKSPDGQETSNLLTLGLRLSRAIGPIDLTLGPGLLHKTTNASGGTVTLSNGHSTSPFGIPPSGASMNLLYLDAGLGGSYWGFRGDLNVLMTDLMGSRRAYDGMVTVSYGLF